MANKTSMIKKMAKAIFGEYEVGNFNDADESHHCYLAAKAVVMALENPTERMATAGYDALQDGPHPRDCWEAMIGEIK